LAYVFKQPFKVLSAGDVGSMSKRLSTCLALGATAVILPFTAFAADMPVKAAPVVPGSGFYAWIDGSYESIKLPTYGLGWRYIDPANFDRGITTTYDPRATGGGGSGALGYVFQHGTLPAAFGENFRVELGGSYVHATASQSASSAPGNSFTTQLVSGLVTAAIGCAPCYNTSTLSTTYAAGTVDLKAASDFRHGTVMLTPSLTLFGGWSRNDQHFVQGQGFVGFPQFVGSSYTADSSVKWNDVGAKLGLNAMIDVAPKTTLGIGGKVGVAARHATMSANDACVNFCTFADFFSSVSTGRDATPFLANAEISATYRPVVNAALRVFAGLNYDSKVPGISSPSFAGAAPSNNTPFLGTPAGISFSSQTSYYAGGGLTVMFAPGSTSVATLR
jgi:hypothetical protein